MVNDPHRQQALDETIAFMKRFLKLTNFEAANRDELKAHFRRMNVTEQRFTAEELDTICDAVDAYFAQ